MYKYEFGSLQSGFDNKFDKNQDVHHCNIRQALSLTAFKFQSFLKQGYCMEVL